MTIDQKLEILKRAIENGARVNFVFFTTETERNANEAKVLSELFPEFGEAEQVEYDYETKLFRLESYEHGIEGIIYYD